MNRPPWIIPPEVLARVARLLARKPRHVQRAGYRAARLAEAERRRTAIPPLIPAKSVDGPPNPPAVVS
ncbi:MAG TPA: hypothetical protein PKE29_08360 [Phycisphaerales bacterium]|nr:hypothetical protein [Phycisphaerales bacterium]